MKSQKSKEIIKELAKEKWLKKEIVEEVTNSQFRLVKLTMEEMNGGEEHYPIIQLPKWGKFLVTEKAKRKFKNE